MTDGCSEVERTRKSVPPAAPAPKCKDCDQSFEGWSALEILDHERMYHGTAPEYWP